MKLGDFGVAGYLDNEHPSLKTKTGTYGFMAPEVNLGQAYNCKADIYSLGCTAVQMAEGTPGDSLRRNHWSLDFVSFVRLCCTPDQKNRPNIKELKNVLNE